jgi:hypothetical protein
LSLALARLSIVPLALLEWIIVYIYFKYFDSIEPWSLKRISFWLFLFFSVLAIPFAQVLLYRHIGSVTGRVDDLFVAVTISGESIVSLGWLLICIARRQWG